MQRNVPPWKDLVIVMAIVGSFIALTPLNIMAFEAITSAGGMDMNFLTNSIMLGCILVQVAGITVPLWRRLTRGKGRTAGPV